MDIETRRQAVFLSLLRHAPEATQLRERVLDRVVLAALLETSKGAAKKIGTIKQTLMLGAEQIELRHDVIYQSATRLLADGLIDRVDIRHKFAYFITKKGAAELTDLAKPAEDLFDDVCSRLFAEAHDRLDRGTASRLFRQFAIEAFARYGRQLARNVTGSMSLAELMQASDFAQVCRGIIKGESLSPEEGEVLVASCMHFIKSNEPRDAELKFALTQGYYFAQLLCVDHAQFNPLAVETYRGARFFLDTNVLVAGFLIDDDDSPHFSEAVRHAETLGVEFVVTRATIEETRSVAREKIRQLEAVTSKVPREVLEISDDTVLAGYLQARGRDLTLTPERFMAPLESCETTLRGRWSMRVDDRSENEILKNDPRDEIGKVINDASDNTRHRRKTALVLRHDVAHFVLVAEERALNPRTWFLTRDRGLLLAGAELAVDGRSRCYGLTAFLQSISPFIASQSARASFAEVFSALIAEQWRPATASFDMQELKLIGELHEDVMSTPPEQLVLALEYVKGTLLNGENYGRDDAPKFALGIRKFLAKSRDDQMEALQADRDRLSSRASEEALAKRHAEEALRTAEVQRLVDTSEYEVRLEVAEHGARQAEQKASKAVASELRANKRGRIVELVAGTVAAWAAWALAPMIGREYAGLLGSQMMSIRDAVRVGCLAVVVILGGRVIAVVAKTELARLTSFTVMIAVALALVPRVSDGQYSTAANILQVAALAAAVSVALLLTKQDPVR